MHESCPNATLWRPSCKRRTCRVCGPRWVNNWRTVLRHNLESLGRPVVAIAITAPGKDRLPWDSTRCTHGPRAKCSGTRYGCKVQERAAREWSDTLSYRWSLLRNAARQSCRRAGLDPVLVDRIWEPQKRGVPHAHLVLAYGSLLERRAAQAFADELARLAPSHGFGYVQTHLRPMTGAEAAAYLTSYFVGGSKKKPSIKDTVKNELLPSSLIWLTPALTSPSEHFDEARSRYGIARATLVTMRLLRRARHAWAWMRGVCDPPAWKSMREVVAVAHVCRVAFPGRGGPAPPFELGQALAWATAVDDAGDTPRTIWDGFTNRRVRYRTTEGYKAELARYAELLIPAPTPAAA